MYNVSSVPALPFAASSVTRGYSFKLSCFITILQDMLFYLTKLKLKVIP